MVSNDRIKGAAKEVAGETEKQVGGLTGDRAMQDRGHERKTEGKLDKLVGHVKEFLRGDKR